MSNALGKKIDLTAETTGSLPAARITGYPPISSGNLTVVANAAARLAQTGLAVADSTIQTDTGVLYLLTALPESSAGNWTVWNPSIAGLTAANVVNVPAGGIAAVTVQAAIDELDTEKGTKIGIQNQSYVTAADTGIADAYALVVNPAISAYVAGQRFSFQALNANTGASTLAVSGLAAKAIKKNVSDALLSGDILANQWIEVVYDGTNFQLISSSNALPALPYVKVSETQVSGTNGGTFTSGSWATRTIQTEDSDTKNICSIAANQITLASGTYECRIEAPASAVTYHKARLYNATGAAQLLLGTSEFSGLPSASNKSVICGKFTVAAAQALEVQHYCNQTKTTDGLGTPTSIATISEVYTIAEFWKVG